MTVTLKEDYAHRLTYIIILRGNIFLHDDIIIRFRIPLLPAIKSTLQQMRANKIASLEVLDDALEAAISARDIFRQTVAAGKACASLPRGECHVDQMQLDTHLQKDNLFDIYVILQEDIDYSTRSANLI